MTTTMSYSNKNLFLHQYKSALLKLRDMGIFYLGICFALYPMQLIMGGDPIDSGTPYNLFTTHHIYNIGGVFLLFFVALFGILMNSRVNSYMHNSRAVDVFHSLPMKRSTLLRSNTLAAITWQIVPLFIIYTIAVFTSQSLDLVPLYFTEWMRVSALIIALQVICNFSNVMLTGDVNAKLATIFFNGFIPAIVLIYSALNTVYLFGYKDNIQDILEYLLWASPMGLFFAPIFGIGSEDIITTWYFVAIAWAFVAIPIQLYVEKLYTKRLSEIAQSPNRNSFIYKFIIISLTFIGGIILGVVFISISYLDFQMDDMYLHIPLYLIGGIIAYFISYGVYNKKFKLGKKDLILGIIAVLIPTIYTSVVIMDFSGFSTTAIDASKVESVTISSDHFHNLRTRGQDVSYYNNKYNYDITLTSPEAIALVTQLQQEIIDDNKDFDPFNHNYHSYPYFNVDISYNKGTTTANRSYNNPSNKEIYELFNQIETNPEFIAKSSPIIREDSSEVSSITIHSPYSEHSIPLLLGAEEISLLYTAMQSDLQNPQAVTSYYTSLPLVELAVQYKDLDFNTTIGVSVTDQWTNTASALKELGYSDVLVDVSDNISYIRIHHFDYMYYDYYYFNAAVTPWTLRDRYDMEIPTTYQTIYNEDNSEVIADIIANVTMADIASEDDLFLEIVGNGTATSRHYLISGDSLPAEAKNLLQTLPYEEDEYIS